MNETLKHKESKPKVVTKTIPFFKPITIQKKLSVGLANDSYEVEADNMANKVMRMTEPSQQNVSQTGSLVQRKCTACEQEEKIQKKSLAENITPLIQSSSPEGGGQASSHVERQINNSRGGGSSLDNPTKNFMETRFGTDFSDVKIHTGSQAVQMSRELNAQAFTVGSDIYFNEGKYSPNSDSGKHLLAHELTHTVQQSGGIGKKVQRFVTCETQEDCPPRETGEVARSRSEPFELFNLTSGGVGMLISNFAVNSGNIDGDLTLNPRWNTFVSDLITNTHLTWEILGFTDCQGDEALNSNLRTLRATEFYFALPEAARAQVETYGAAPSSSCMRTNSTEANRKLNRSAIIRLKTTRYDFEDDPTTITAKLCGPEITSWLIDQMNTNRNHPVIRNSREIQWPNYIPVFNLGWNYGFLSDFRDLVRAGAVWDFKSRQGRRGGVWRNNPSRPCPSLPCDQTVTMCNMCFNYDVPGNIHYGWVGVAAGLRPWFLHNRADAAQAGGIDDPRDAVAIDIGIRMYQNGTTLCDELTTHRNELNLHNTDDCISCS